MNWSAERTKIRTYLRDPNANVWTDENLRLLYNDTQQDFQHKTGVLEDVFIQRVPGLYHASYQHDWEWKYLPSELSQFYQCLTQHSDAVICHRWEPQIMTGLISDVSDYGIHFTQPWEAFMGQTPGEPVKIRFPKNFNAMKFAAYDEEPISQTDKKRVQSADPSHVTTEGEPKAYYLFDDIDNSYDLYPTALICLIASLLFAGVAPTMISSNGSPSVVGNNIQ